MAKKRPRRPYHKPQIEQVQLVAEEAVLTGCKVDMGYNPGKSNNKCGTGAAPGDQCLLNGS